MIMGTFFFLNIEESAYGYTANKGDKSQGNKHQSSTTGQTTHQQKQSSGSSGNNQSSGSSGNNQWSGSSGNNQSSYTYQDGMYEGYGSDDEEEEENRKQRILSECAADLPRPRRQRRASRLLVQVDEEFSGITRSGEEWRINFRIDIDGSYDGTPAHVGYTISLR
ncbi:unnamed protein product, partial [Didymodactylos carnosus]